MLTNESQDLQIYELKGVLIQGYYRNRGKSSQKDAVRRMLAFAGFLTVFDALRICWTTRQKVFNIFNIFSIFNIFNIFLMDLRLVLWRFSKVVILQSCCGQEMLKMLKVLKMLKTVLKISE